MCHATFHVARSCSRPAFPILLHNQDLASNQNKNIGHGPLAVEPQCYTKNPCNFIRPLLPCQPSFCLISPIPLRGEQAFWCVLLEVEAPQELASCSTKKPRGRTCWSNHRACRLNPSKKADPTTSCFPQSIRHPRFALDPRTCYEISSKQWKMWKSKQETMQCNGVHSFLHERAI